MIHTLVAVDVAGPLASALVSVGSGPTVMRTDAVQRPGVERALRARGSPAGVFTAILSPHDARHAFRRELERRGFRVRVGRDQVADVEHTAQSILRAVRQLRPGEAWIASGEPTVELPARPGRGGRAGRAALYVARAIAGSRDVTCLAVSTDGVDGESGHAGAVVDGETWAKLRRRGVDGDAALAGFDDARAHEAARSNVDVAPTGLNVLDLYAVVRAAGGRRSKRRRGSHRT